MANNHPTDVVEGEMHCAKCKFRLSRRTLYMNGIGNGTNETEPCPNGCGPLWPVTWRMLATELGERLEEYFAELVSLREKVSATVNIEVPPLPDDCKHDLMAYGTAFMKDGKRIDPKDVYIGVDAAKEGSDTTVIAMRDGQSVKILPDWLAKILLDNIDNPTQPQSVAVVDVTRLRKALSEATSILEGAGYVVQVAEYKEILEETE